MMVEYFVPDKEKRGLWLPQTLELPYINTQEFRREGMYFDKYDKYDCGEPGTLEYVEWWKEQEKRSIYGYTVAGVRVTGDHYFYLNFCQIDLSDQDGKTEVKVRTAGRKVRQHPAFWEGDYFYFHLKEIARKHALHLCVAKSRRKGFSYKNAAIAVKRYKMFGGSATVLIASSKQYLYEKGRGIMTMAKDYVGHINAHTNWSRSMLKASEDHIKDGYRIPQGGGVYTDGGFLSEIYAFTAKDNPDVARGKDGALVVIDEAGKFPNLQETLDYTEPIVGDGMMVSGQIIVFGTGGGKNNNWAPFEKLFYEPEDSHFLPCKNVWDTGMSHTTCGFFYPEDLNFIGKIDHNGYSLRAETLEYVQEVRAAITDPVKLKRHCAERPLKPSEAFARDTKNNFHTELLEAHKRRLVAEKEEKKYPCVDIIPNKGGATTRLSENIPINRYPHKADDNLAGGIVIYDQPFKEPSTNQVPADLYYIAVDAYMYEETSSTESLASVIVGIVPTNKTEDFGDKIVCTYTGRPSAPGILYDNIIAIAEYYNAKVCPEYEGSSGLIQHFRLRQKFHLLDGGFTLTDDKKGGTRKSSTTIGLKMASGRTDIMKETGDAYISEWLIKPRGYFENGEPFYNLHTIKDIGLLDELIKYGKGNFDRVAALRVLMYFMKESSLRKTVKAAGSSALGKLMGAKLFRQ